MAKRVNPLVSVILPVYNGEPTLDRALASAVAQSNRNIEILVVDDGSSDGTLHLIEQWCARDSRIRCFRQSQSGVGAARNRAIAEARGEFIAPLDHDDVWTTDKIASQLALFEGADDRLALVSSGWARIDADERILSQTDSPIGQDDPLTALAHRNYMVSGSIPLMRRAAVLHVGGYSEALRAANAQGCEDYLLYLRLAEHYAFAHVPRALVGYRTGANAMSQDIDQMIRSYRMVTDELSARHPSLRPVFRAGLIRLLRHKSTRALRRGDWGQALAVAAQIITTDPRNALSSYATSVVNVLRRLWLGHQRTSAAVGTPRFMTQEPENAVQAMPSGSDEIAGLGI